MRPYINEEVSNVLFRGKSANVSAKLAQIHDFMGTQQYREYVASKNLPWDDWVTALISAVCESQRLAPKQTHQPTPAQQEPDFKIDIDF